MAKETILTYLDKQLTKKIPEYDIALDWDTKNHTIEIILRLFAENPAHLTIDDANGVTSEEEIIEFEDGILLFDSQKSTVIEENYLATIPFAGKKGMPKSILDRLILSIKEILDQGTSDLLDFLQSDENEDEFFELSFDQDALLDLIADNQPKDKEVFLPYPSY